MIKNLPATANESTKDRIIDAAEALIAEFGINGVTFREIGLAAGQNNKSGVQYHFGDKITLVNEILMRRYVSLERRRVELLSEIERAGRLETVRACLELFHMPTAELTDKNGRHTYARFYLQYILNMKYEAHIVHPGFGTEPTMTSQRVYKILQEILWYIPDSILRARIFQAQGMFLVALLEYDNAVIHDEPHQVRAEFLDGIFNVMVAAVKAPLPGAGTVLDP